VSEELRSGVLEVLESMADITPPYTFDHFIEVTVRLRKAVEWLKRAKDVKPIQLPFSIDGLDDPIWLDYEEQEQARLGRIERAKDEIEGASRKLQMIEADLVRQMPFGVWVLHEYRDRLFGIGVAYDHARRFPKRIIKITLVDSEEDLRRQLPLRWNSRSLALVPEWESTARASLRG
jgi:hypothetical protein